MLIPCFGLIPIEVNADYFITVDKGILKKRNIIKNLEIVNPIDFITILEGRNDTEKFSLIMSAY